MENFDEILAAYEKDISFHENFLSRLNKMRCENGKREISLKDRLSDERAKPLHLRDHAGMREAERLLTGIVERDRDFLERQNDVRNVLKILRESKRHIERLVSERDSLRERLAELESIPYTLWRGVLAMRKQGMTDKRIAERLHDKGQGLSRSQLGALLYTGREEMPASITLQVHGAKFFDKPDADSE